MRERERGGVSVALVKVQSFVQTCTRITDLLNLLYIAQDNGYTKVKQFCVVNPVQYQVYPDQYQVYPVQYQVRDITPSCTISNSA